MYLCSNIGIKHILRDLLLAIASHLMLDMCFAAADAALHADSQLAALKCVHCQNLHVDTTLSFITSKNVCKCSVYSKT